MRRHARATAYSLHPMIPLFVTSFFNLSQQHHTTKPNITNLLHPLEGACAAYRVSLLGLAAAAKLVAAGAASRCPNGPTIIPFPPAHQAAAQGQTQSNGYPYSPRRPRRPLSLPLLFCLLRLQTSEIPHQLAAEEIPGCAFRGTDRPKDHCLID